MTLRDEIKAIQGRVGVRADGVPGPLTFAAIRAALDERDGLRTEVDALKSGAGLAETGAGRAAGGGEVSKGLRDPAAFYEAVRASFGPLKQSQVDGFNALIDAMGAAGWPLSWAAYGLATAWHETAFSMQPVEEGYYLGSRAKAHRKGLRYHPWHGRGYVQLTWETNYRRADDELALDGALLADPAKAMDPVIAANVMVRGMAEGWFTGKKLGGYLPINGSANPRQFALARWIINGQDKASKIADEAMKFQAALEAGGWR